jgi:hypothetical protein
MKLVCKLELDLGDKTLAENVCKAVRLDDGQYIESKAEGTKLVAVAESESILELRSTLEDYLACVSVAEKTAKMHEK